MATALQSLSANSMTLGNQTSKMYTMIQQHSPGQNNNCVIITTQPNITQKNTVIIQQSNCGKRPLAAATERSSVVVNNNTINIANNNTADMLRCKRKISFAHMPYGPNGTPVHHHQHQPASVARRNARERNRVKQVNNGFATLRQHIPASVAAALSTSSSSSSSSSRGASKKLSKVETLRMAVEYIRSLQQMIQDHESELNSNNPVNNDGTNPNSMGQMSESQYYASSPDTNLNINHNLILQQTPPCSESSASPTPSYSSEGSISHQSVYTPLTVYQQESYENYEPMSPEDEELLDVISWWQQQ